MTRIRWLIGCFVLGLALASAALPASAAEESTGPPQITRLRATPVREETKFKLSAVVAPGHLETTWRIEVGNFGSCVIHGKRSPPKKVAEGTITADAGATEIRASTPDNQNGARKFYVTVRNSDGQAMKSHGIPQGGCTQE